MKKMCFVILMFCVLFFALQSAWGQNNYVEFTLKGFEIAKGNNIDEETRVGARFMGSIINSAGDEIGFFSTVLDFRGYNYIEVCGKTNDIIVHLHYFPDHRFLFQAKLLHVNQCTTT